MNWNDFSIEFTINQEGTQFWANGNGEKVLNCSLKSGQLDVAVKYDFLNKPHLHLSSEAKVGDKIKVHILPYRLELYINGMLSDEEWPCGEHYLRDCPIIDNGCNLSICESVTSKGKEPSVLGVFQNVEGWKPEENVLVGDCMPYCHNGIYHVLYLKDRHRHGSKWGLEHISGATFQQVIL